MFEEVASCLFLASSFSLFIRDLNRSWYLGLFDCVICLPLVRGEMVCWSGGSDHNMSFRIYVLLSSLPCLVLCSCPGFMCPPSIICPRFQI